MRGHKVVSPRSIERIIVLNGSHAPHTIHKRKNKKPKNLKQWLKSDSFKKTVRTAAAVGGVVRAVRVASARAAIRRTLHPRARPLARW